MLLNRVVCLAGHKGCHVTPLLPSYVEGIIFSQVSVHRAIHDLSRPHHARSMRYSRVFSQWLKVDRWWWYDVFYRREGSHSWTSGTLLWIHKIMPSELPAWIVWTINTQTIRRTDPMEKSLSLQLYKRERERESEYGGFSSLSLPQLTIELI